jgi:hypothetical protein
MKMSTPQLRTPKSKLPPIGILLMVVGLLGRQPLAKAALAMQPGAFQRVLLLAATDGLILCFFAGVICALLGWLRNRREQRLATDRQPPHSNT